MPNIDSAKARGMILGISRDWVGFRGAVSLRDKGGHGRLSAATVLPSVLHEVHELDNPTGRDRNQAEPRQPGPGSNTSESDQANWIRVRPEYAGAIGLSLDAAF